MFRAIGNFSFKRAGIDVLSDSRLTTVIPLRSPQDDNDQPIVHHLIAIHDSPVRDSLKLILTPLHKNLIGFIQKNIADSCPISVIVGPPGVGKTVTTALTIFDMAHHYLDKEFLWIPVNRFSEGGGVFRIMNRQISQVPLVFTKDTCLIVYDGINKSNYREWKSIIENHLKQVRNLTSEVPLCFILSSLQTNIVDAYKGVVSCPIRELRMKPWSKSMFYKAVEDDEIFEAVKDKFDIDPTWIDSEDKASRRALVDEKFPLAGFCARWMFDVPSDELPAIIDSKIEQLSGCKTWKQEVESSSLAVNHLFYTLDDGKNAPTSNYVLRKLLKKGDSDFLVEFLNSSHYVKDLFNPALDGWIFELDFLMCIKRGVNDPTIQNRFSLVVGETLTRDADFFVSDWQMFHSTKVFNLTAENIRFADHQWYIPEIYCQGGFDLAQLVSSKIRFFQLTRAEKHDLKMEYMVVFLQHLNGLRFELGLSMINEVEVIFVTPADVSNFEIGATTGMPRNGTIQLPNGQQAQFNSSIALGKFVRYGFI